MFLQTSLGLAVVACILSFTNALTCDCVSGAASSIYQPLIADPLVPLLEGGRYYPGYAPGVVQITRESPLGLISRPSILGGLSTLQEPRILLGSPVRDSLVASLAASGRSDRLVSSLLDAERLVRPVDRILDLSNPSVDRVLLGSDGLRLNSPLAASLNLLDARIPSASSRVNVNVGYDAPRYAPIAPLLPSIYQPRSVANEKVKLPSVSLKERETVYLGAEQERQHVAHPNSIIKGLDLGCK